jgi:hypothetical protein
LNTIAIVRSLRLGHGIAMALALVLFQESVFAQSALRRGLAGAAEGMGDSLMRWAEHEERRRLMLEQHRLEMERLEREHALRMEAMRRHEEQRNREREAEAERQAQEQLHAYRQQQLEVAARQEELRREEERRALEEAKVEQKHPGWKKMVASKSFRDWWARQPESLKRLGDSDNAEDAITVLDLYKRDRPRRGK